MLKSSAAIVHYLFVSHAGAYSVSGLFGNDRILCGRSFVSAVDKMARWRQHSQLPLVSQGVPGCCSDSSTADRLI